MFDREVSTARRPLVFRLVAVLAAAVVAAAAGAVWAAEGDGRRPLTEEEGVRVARAALAYAEVEYVVGGVVQQGMPYVWGGRTTVEQLLNVVAQAAADDATPALAGSAADPGAGQSAAQPGAGAVGSGTGSLIGLGVDASGVAVNALRALGPAVRFAASGGASPAWLADATSSMLYHYNVVHLDPSEIRAGDLIFFGTAGAGTVSVTGVGVVTGRSGTRVDFVVASAREGRVVATFARTDGEYWRDNIVGAGRFLIGDL